MTGRCLRLLVAAGRGGGLSVGGGTHHYPSRPITHVFPPAGGVFRHEWPQSSERGWANLLAIQ